MAARHARVTLTGAGRGTVEVDGRPVPGVRAVRVAGAYDQVPRLVLELVVAEVDVETADGVEVVLPDRTVEALRTLGWTPPTGGDK